MESWYKNKIKNGIKNNKEISCVNPDWYQDRFIKFINKEVLRSNKN